MFNRHFFERDFSRLIGEYSADKGSETPVVEFHLRDGSRHHVETIQLVADTCLSFRVAPDPGRSSDGKQPDQITCPYASIVRVDFHPRLTENKVGFRISRG
ncbi:MAG: hypothetical protein EB084_20800 [Proteobacteria bacterium]|nr:hypothetical protein [Pseudomonadota bacterium]